MKSAKMEACGARLLVAFLAPMLVASSCRNRGKSIQEAGAPQKVGEALKEALKGEKTMTEKFEITQEEKKWLMKLAKDAVRAAVKDEEFTPPEPPSPGLKEKGAAFVTLRKGGELRGCIGHIVARIPLYECIAQVAQSAAIEDPRFSPVKPSEYDSLHFEISVLTPPQEVKDPNEIEVGKDGVILSYGGAMQGVFLPQVPIEQGWDLVEYLDNLCYKAGVMKRGCWKDPLAKLKKFQAVVWEEEEVK